MLLTSESEPNDQNEIERASGLLTAESVSPTIALRIAETPMPIVINCNAERASENVSKVAAIAPIAAQTTAPAEPMLTKLVSTPSRTPSDAPAEVPRIAGSAKGLLVEL